MKNIAVLELDVLNVKLTIATVIKQNALVVLHQSTEPINFVADIEEDEIIKNAKINEMVEICQSFKSLCETYQVVETTCLAQRSFYNVKNEVSFFEQVYNKCGLKFREMTEEEEINGFYYAVVNSIDVSRGLLFAVNTNDTVILNFSKRSIFEKTILPYGTLNILQKLNLENAAPAEVLKGVTNFFKNELLKVEWLKSVEPELTVVGMGRYFSSICKLARRLTKYPLEIENMYPLTQDDFETVYNFVSGLDLDKTKKIKGISKDRADLFVSSIAIYKAIFESIEATQLFATKPGFSEGALSCFANPNLNDKPYPDILGNSLDVINEFYTPKPNNIEHVYLLTVVLYKQLKVLHKLPRTYVKALRIAANLYNCGDRINPYESNRCAYDIVKNSYIMGASHRDILLASFILLCTKLDDFSLTEWIKYKNLLTDEDIDAVKKLAVIVNLAVSLDRFSKRKITDVSCDILGDSIIIKTQSEQPAPLEIREGMKNEQDFKKVFKKNLELL
ncbi:MAG: hypothetical protein ACI4T1_02270 [Christensenellales bacterium]